MSAECENKETLQEGCIQECQGLTEVVGAVSSRLSTIYNRIKLSARRRHKASSRVDMSKEVDRRDTVSMDEETDTNSDKNEQEQMELGSQPSRDQMEVEVVVGNGMKDKKVELELVVEAMQVDDRVGGYHHGDGDEGDGDRGDVPGGGVHPDVQTRQVQTSRPQA